LFIKDKKSPIRISVEVSAVEAMVDDPMPAGEAVFATLQDLQTKFLCSFDGNAYIDERLRTFWGEHFELPLPRVTDKASPMGRRLVLQQSMTVRWEVERRIKAIDELSALLDQESVLDSDIRKQQTESYSSLREALVTRLKSIATDPSQDILERLGHFDPARYAMNIPTMIIDEAFLEEPKEATLIYDDWWAKVGSEIDVLSPPRCQTQAEILLHPVALAVLKRTVGENYQKQSALMALSEALSTPEQIDQFIQEGQNILRRLHAKKPLRVVQVQRAISVFMKAVKYLYKTSEAILDKGDFDKQLQSTCSTLEDKQEIMHMPLSVCFLRYLLANYKELGLSDADWIDMAISDRGAKESKYLFPGRELPEGRFLKREAIRHWSDIGQVRKYHFIDGNNKTNTGLFFHKDKKRLPLTFDLSRNGEQAPVIRISVDPPDRGNNHHSLDGVLLFFGEEEEGARRILFSEEEFKPLLARGEYMTDRFRLGKVHIKTEKESETASFYQVVPENTKPFVQLEHENQHYQLFLNGEPVIDCYQRDYLDAYEVRKQMQWVITEKNEYLISRDGTTEFFCEDDCLILKNTQVYYHKPIVSRGMKFKGIPSTEGEVLCVYFTHPEVEHKKSFLKKKESKKEQVFLKSKPVELKWELIDEKGEIQPGATLDNAKFIRIYSTYGT